MISPGFSWVYYITVDVTVEVNMKFILPLVTSINRLCLRDIDALRRTICHSLFSTIMVDAPLTWLVKFCTLYYFPDDNIETKPRFVDGKFQIIIIL